MIGSIPGYFVGLGLLLTFIGLVLALHKAAAAVSSADAGGMQLATRELLQVATFKFSTSIAGLGASIVLSFFFRTFLIAIESSFEHFCRVVEEKLSYSAPQSIAAEMNDRLGEQVTELKAINSEKFFSMMGQGIAPQIRHAINTAMAPVATTIDQAVRQLADNSQSGISEMVERFSNTVQSNAGTELRELATTLKDMQAAMVSAQQGINGSGEDFGRRMSEAAEGMSRMIADAGERLGDGSDKSRTAMMEAVTAMRETFERANRKVDEELGAAAAGASSRVEDAMGRVLHRLEGQVDDFRNSLVAFQQGMSSQAEETRSKISSVQLEAVDIVGRVSEEAAKALQSGIGEAMQRITGEFDRFAQALRSGETSLVAQTSAVRDATDQSRLVADAFSRTAQDVRTAAIPLAQAGERIAGATERMSETVAQSVAALEIGQASSKQLAEALAAHASQLATTWENYSSKFERVDEDLGRAISELGQSTERQVQLLNDYASKVDQGFATAIEKLNPLLEGLNTNTEDLGGAVENLHRVLMPRAAE